MKNAASLAPQKIDFERLQNEILLALRGDTSQKRLSYLLGFRSNRVHRWESGEVSISWNDFSALCRVRRVALEDACRTKLHYAGPPENTAQFIQHLTGQAPQDQIAKRLGVSRSMVSRWRSGKVAPSLQIMLQLIDISHFSLADFLGGIIDIRALPTIQAAYEKERKEKELHTNNPWVAALLLYLRTVEYNELKKHQVGFLAKKLGIPLELEMQIFNELLDSGAIETEGDIFAPRLRGLNTASDFESNIKIREYWTSRCLRYFQQLKSPKPDNIAGYMVLNTSPETLAQIKQRYLDFYQDVHSIVQASTTPSETVYLLNIQILNVEDLPHG